MEGDNNNGSFVPIDELPHYNINTDMSLQIFGVFIHFYVNRRGISLSHIEMQHEFFRYITFYDFPRSRRDIRDFVLAGFYYSQDRDFVVCYCCGYRRGNWRTSEVPSDIHQRFSPHCIFFHANDTVDIPYHIFFERYERFFPYFTRVNAQNRHGPSPVSERFARGEEHLFRVHGVRPEINEESETYENIPLANLPMGHGVLATDSRRISFLDYLEGVQIRRLDSRSTSEDSVYLTGLRMEHVFFSQTTVILHNHSINIVDHTNFSEPSISGSQDYQRSLRNQENGTLAATGPREELEEEHDYTMDIEPEVQLVRGILINESQENQTDETERKAIYQPETNRKSEFVINGRKENISPKIIPAQYLTKTANDTSSLQVELSSNCIHHSNISFENNTDVATMLSEVTTSDIDSTNSIRDQSIGQTAEVNGQIDISLRGGKEKRSSADLLVSTISKSREVANISRENKNPRNSADKEMTPDHQRYGFEPHQNNTSPVLSILSQNSQPNSNERLEGSFRSNAYQTDEEGAGENISTIADATGTEEDETPDNQKIGHDEDMFDANSCNYKKPTGDNDSAGKENVIIDPGGSTTHTKKICTTEDPEFYTSRTPGPSTRDTSDTINVQPSYKMEECLSGMFIIHIGFEPYQNITSPVSGILSQKSQSNSNEPLDGSIFSNAYQTDEEGAADSTTTIADATGTDEDVTPDSRKISRDEDMFESNSVNYKKRIGDNDNAGNENVIIDPGYSQTLTTKICTTEDRELYTSPAPEPPCDTINLKHVCNSEGCLSDTFVKDKGIEPHQNNTSPVLSILSQNSQPNSNERLQGSFRCNAYQTDEEEAGENISTIEDATGTEEGDAGSDINNYFENKSSPELRSSDKTEITKAGEKHSEEKVKQRNQCIYTPDYVQEPAVLPFKSHAGEADKTGKENIPKIAKCGQLLTPKQTVDTRENQKNDITDNQTLLCSRMSEREESFKTNVTETAYAREAMPISKDHQSILKQKSDDKVNSLESDKQPDENSTQRNQCLYTTEQAGCHTIQGNSDQGSSHIETPAEQEKGGTEILLEKTTEDIQQTVPCVENESDQTSRSKEGNIALLQSFEGPADHSNTDGGNDQDEFQIVDHTNTTKSFHDTKQLVKKEEGVSLSKSREITQNQSTKILMTGKFTYGIADETETNGALCSSTGISTAEEPNTETRTHHVTKDDDKAKSFIDLGVVMMENDHLKRPADQKSHKIKEQGCFQNAVEAVDLANVQEKEMFQSVTNCCVGQDASIGGKENTDGQNEPSDYTKVKTDPSSGTPSCQDIQHQNSTSLPVKLGEEKVSAEYLRKCRSCNDVVTQTENSPKITRISVSQDNANTVDDTLLPIRPVIAQENGTETYQETKAGQHSLLANEDMSVSQGRNGTDGNKSHITQNADEFNVDMRSHNEASIQSETGQAAETNIGEHAAYIAVKRPDEGRQGRSIKEDRVVPMTSREERNSLTDMIASETPKTNGKTKSFLPVDVLPNDTSRVSKENVESRKLELTDNDELLFAKDIAREMEKIKDPERRNDVKMQCFKMIFEAQKQERSFEK